MGDKPWSLLYMKQGQGIRLQDNVQSELGDKLWSLFSDSLVFVTNLTKDNVHETRLGSKEMQDLESERLSSRSNFWSASQKGYKLQSELRAERS